jgi:type I restriction-modification system DNA methylase subunit
MTEYNKLSIDLTKAISREEKKKDGIFFTPPETISKNIELLKPYFKDIKSILEPSCGSCEFINMIRKFYPSVTITGIEKNKEIFDAIQHIPNIQFINEDFLKISDEKKYDLIIGNPPYFVMKKNDVEKKYHEFFEGRPNIFILFIIRSLHLLNENGILSFVLPKNFLNCLYYSKTRKYIFGKYTILNIMECNDNYIDTQQETIIITLQNKGDIDDINKDFTLNMNEYYIFGRKEDICILRKLYLHSTSLNKLNFRVSVGRVVWNQCKSILTTDESKTRLIYSSDIKDGNLDFKQYKNDAKKNFIDLKGLSDPILVINRGYGTGNYKFEYCLIEGDFEYLIENHLICIKYNKEEKKEKNIEAFHSIIKSLNDDRTKQFIQLYFGNNAINTTELNNVLPIYLK